MSTYERLVNSQNFFSPYLTQEDLSRLGRNYIETGRFIDLEFPRYNTQFIAVNENFDSNGGDRFLVAVWNLLNELYAMDISNKQKKSIRAKK